MKKIGVTAKVLELLPTWVGDCDGNLDKVRKLVKEGKAMDDVTKKTFTS